MQYRIGARDPVTGLYEVIHPDGSRLLNGIKIFNSAYAEGDPVLATERSDGMMILDGVNAVEDVSNNSSTQISKFGAKPTSYLTGQVFNNEDEVLLPLVSVDFAPESLRSLTPGGLNELQIDKARYLMRVKVNRQQQKDLEVEVIFTGTAPRSTYNATLNRSGNIFLQQTVKILATSLTAEVVITPNQLNFSGESKTIVFMAIQGRGFRLGVPSVTAIVLYLPIVTLSLVQSGALFFTFSANLDRVQAQNVNCIISLVSTLSANFYIVSPAFSNSLDIPAGSQSASFSIQILNTPELGKSITVSIQKSDDYRRDFPTQQQIFIN